MARGKKKNINLWINVYSKCVCIVECGDTLQKCGVQWMMVIVTNLSLAENIKGGWRGGGDWQYLQSVIQSWLEFPSFISVNEINAGQIVNCVWWTNDKRPLLKWIVCCECCLPFFQFFLLFLYLLDKYKLFNFLPAQTSQNQQIAKQTNKPTTIPKTTLKKSNKHEFLCKPTRESLAALCRCTWERNRNRD